MACFTEFECHRFFFHFGEAEGPLSDGPPLVCLNGGIMADTGSEALSYIYTCQDRYPVYAAFGGMRCLLFVRDDEHLRGYEARRESVERHLDTIRNATGFAHR